MTDKEIEKIITEFMGYCSVRYSTDNVLAMSEEDIKFLQGTIKRIHAYHAKEILRTSVSELEKYGCQCSMLALGRYDERMATLKRELEELEKGNKKE